jgi:hypothetical protein
MRHTRGIPNSISRLQGPAEEQQGDVSKSVILSTHTGANSLLYTIQTFPLVAFTFLSCDPYNPIYGDPGSKLTVRVTVSVFVTRALVTVATAVVVEAYTPVGMRQAQADDGPPGPRPSEMLIWRLTGSSAGQAAS